MNDPEYKNRNSVTLGENNIKEIKMVFISALVVVAFIMVFLIVGVIWLLTIEFDPRSTALTDEDTLNILSGQIIEIDLSDYYDIDISFGSTNEINVYVQE